MRLSIRKKGFIRFGYEVLETEIKFFVKDTGEGIPKMGVRLP